MLALTLAPSAAVGRAPGGALFGHVYRSTSVVKDGARYALVDGTRVRLRFVHEDQRDVAGWSAGCNAYGGRLAIKPHHLEISEITQTDVGCPQPLLRQESWVARFFDSDPRWHRAGQKLRLRSGDDAIRLRHRRACRGHPATITGDPGANSVEGTDGRDVIVTGRGKDDITGNGGHDLICSGRGDDYVHGTYGDGPDRVYAGRGDDIVHGGDADDHLFGNRGRDTLAGDPGEDLCYGGRDHDIAVDCERVRSAIAAVS